MDDDENTPNDDATPNTSETYLEINEDDNMDHQSQLIEPIDDDGIITEDENEDEEDINDDNTNMEEIVFHGGAIDQSTTLRSIYNKSVLTKPITVGIQYLGSNVQNVAERIIRSQFEGKCIEEGFIKPQSIRNVQCSIGMIVKGHMIKMMVTFECDICHPVENMIIKCVVKKISKAGIQLDLETLDAPYSPSPIIAVDPKEYSYNNPLFINAKLHDSVYFRIIGIRYELNDSFISVIGKIIKPRTALPKPLPQP